MAGESLQPITNLVRSVAHELRKVKEALRRPTFPVYPDEPANPLETQIAWFGTTVPSYFRDSAWHEFGGVGLGGGSSSGGLIAGNIEGTDGSIISGTGGFSVVRNTGPPISYDITFTPTLAVIPVVIASHGGPTFGGGTDALPATSVSTSGFAVATNDADDWCFIAVVPSA